uniref:Transmembrane protein n=1 Tax=Parastrongyloides trichosuri TaxID=131310 RepID=A0A0N4ZTA1_PARTI
MLEPSNNDIINKESYRDQTIYLTLNETIHVFNLSLIIFCFQGILFWIAIRYTFPYSLYIFIPAVLISIFSLYGFYTKSKSALYPLLCYYLSISSSLPIFSITITIASIVESTTNAFTEKDITIYKLFDFSDNLINLIPLNIALFVISIIYLYKFNILHRCIDYCGIAVINDFDETHDLKPGTYSGASDMEKVPIVINDELEEITITNYKDIQFTVMDSDSENDYFKNRKRA